MKKLFTFILSGFTDTLAFPVKKHYRILDQSLLEKYFEKYVIGNDFTVTLAKDSTADLTSDV